MTDLLANVPQPQIDELVRLVMGCGFSPASYREANLDIAQHCPSDYESVLHYICAGWSEGRPLSFDADIGNFLRLLNFCRSMGLGRIAMNVLGAATRSAVARRGLFNSAMEILSWHSLNARIIFIIGDSHTGVYSVPFERSGAVYVPLPLMCTGGSAMGLDNPHSSSGYGMSIRTQLDGIFKFSSTHRIPILMKFGQVDVEFVSTFRRLRSNSLRFSEAEAIEFYDRSTTAYASFLHSAVPRLRRKNVDVLGVFPPALSDEAIQNGYFNNDIARREGVLAPDLQLQLQSMEHPDISMRTRLHAAYNTLLMDKVESGGFTYVDDFHSKLNEAGVIDRQFAGSAERVDHHILRTFDETAFDDLLYERFNVRRSYRFKVFLLGKRAIESRIQRVRGSPLRLL